MKILELMHNLEEAYNRFGDIDVYCERNTMSTRSLELVEKVRYDSEEFVITYGEFR